MTAKHRIFSKEQINDLRLIVQKEIKFSDLVREYTKVDQIGEWFAVACPFHQTRTTDAGRLKDGDPISGSEGIYFCNHPGCSVQSHPYEGKLSLTRFWQLMYDFQSEPEAVLDLYENRLSLKLPEGNGTPLTKEQKEQYAHDKRMSEMFLHITYFYHKALREDEGKEARDYIIEERKIPEEYVHRYRLGFAPGQSKLKDYLKESGFTETEMKKAKILSKKENDLYYKRVIFPLLDARHNVWDSKFNINKAIVRNFYSRFLPKYLNDNNSFLKHRYTNKNFPLYNFAEARRKRHGLMIEGCFDTIASQVFVDRLVDLNLEGKLPSDFTLKPEDIGPFASYGTNGFSEEIHVPQLKRANFDILFIAGDHDANFAGQEANIKRGRMLQKHLPDTQIRVVTWGQKDVNELLKLDTDPVEFLRYLEDSVSLEEYEILVALEKSGSADVVRNQFEAIHRIEDLLKNLNLQEENSLLKYKKTLMTVAKFIGVDVETILLQVMLVKHKNDMKKAADDANVPLKALIMAELATIISVFGEE